MPLRASYGPLFSAAWVAELKSSPESAQIATIRIVDPNQSQRTYNPVTDTWTDSETQIYFGKARVQPLRNANRKEVRGNETTVQTFLFSLPIAETAAIDFRTGYIAQVIDSPLNPALLHYQYVLTEVTDSSNPIETTLMFSVNQETSV